MRMGESAFTGFGPGSSRQAEALADASRLFRHYDRTNTGALSFEQFKRAVKKDGGSRSAHPPCTLPAFYAATGGWWGRNLCVIAAGVAVWCRLLRKTLP